MNDRVHLAQATRPCCLATGFFGLLEFTPVTFVIAWSCRWRLVVSTL